MKDVTDMMKPSSSQQTSVLWVVRTACIVTVFGVAVMALLAWYEKPIPDQFDRLVQLAAVGALALLGRTSDTKTEAKEAAEQMVNDLAALSPEASEPKPVEPEVP